MLTILLTGVALTSVSGVFLYIYRTKGDTGESLLFHILYTIYTTPVGLLFHQRQIQADKENRQMAALANHTVAIKPHTLVPDSEERFIVKSGNVLVRYIPYLKDNYAYLLICTETGHAAIVDPGDPEAVESAFRKECGRQESGMDSVYESIPPLKLVAILVTHYHWDHSGGNIELKHDYPGLVVHGGRHERMWGVAGATNYLEDGDNVMVGSLRLSVTHTPGHTVGHIMYSYDDAENSVHFTFTGDHIFQAGTGRFFESTNGKDMHQSLTARIGHIPRPSLVLCGHEYSVENLKFAAMVEPQNEAIRNRLQYAIKQRAAQLTTLATTLGDEMNINPFIRLPLKLNVTLSQLLEDNELSPNNRDSPEQILVALRKLKDLGLHLE